MEGRLCITTDGEVMDWRTENMDYATTKEVCKRVALYLRMTDLTLDTRVETVSDIGKMVTLEHVPGSPKVCIVLLLELGALQIMIQGTSHVGACQLCDEVIRHIDQEIFKDEPA